MRPTGQLARSLRDLVKASTESENQIARGSGVSQSTLNLFMNERRDLRLDTANRLANYFGLCFCPADSTNTKPR